jgi:hypothetical protein
MSAVKKYDEFLNEKSFIGFLSGVGKGMGDLARETVFSSKRDEKTQDKNALLNLAKNVKYTVEYTATEIDNLIAADKQIRGDKAEIEGAKEIQNTLR